MKCLRSTHLKSTSFEETNLVVLRQFPESGDAFGKLYHLPYSRSEAHGELFPDSVARFMWVHIGRSVHGTHLVQEAADILEYNASNAGM